MFFGNIVKIKVDITAHIRELLFGHECVIIPGFGGFIGNYTPARLDKASGIFHPPVKKISFNRNLNHNDGLLIKKVCGSTGMNYGDTRNMVEEFVSGMRRKLERGERVVFDHIGSFINNHEGNVQFEPEENVNYHLDSYGFESFRCVPLEGYDVRRKIAAVQHKDVAQRRILRKYIWRAAVVIPLAGAIAFVSLDTNFLKTKVEVTSMNPLVSAELEHNKVAVDNEIAGQVIEETFVPAVTATEEASITENLPAEPAEADISEKVPVVPTGNFYVITGSFQSEENAGRQVSQLQTRGFNPKIVSINGFYRVCAMECPDLETALSKKDSIIASFPGAWISKKK